MNFEKKYYAFISYSHQDEEWAKWLQHEFEHYHLPTTLNGLPNLPEKFRPIFRDVDELSGGELKPQISYALMSSANLVILCSPNSAKSKYVNDEILEFIEIGKQNGVNNISNIFPFIIEGIPHSKEKPEYECFPEALKSLPSELIAGDATKHGREHAFVKILSGTLRKSDIGFSMLWNQFERDRIEKERKEREQRNRLLMLESRYISAKALDVAPFDSQLARMLVSRVLPKDINDPEDRPYCPEAESTLRKILYYKSAVLKTGPGMESFMVNQKCDRGVSGHSDGSIRTWDLNTGLQIGEALRVHDVKVVCTTYSHDGNTIASSSIDCSIILWNTCTGKRKSLKCSSGYAKKMTFTHNDKQLIVMSTDSILMAWDMEKNCWIHETKVPESNNMAIDRSDKLIALATMNFSIVIYDLTEFKTVKTISNAHSESLISVDFSPDGKKLLSSAFDGKFKIWNLINGEMELAKSAGVVNGAYGPIIFSARYSDNGNSIVTTSKDNIVRVWSVPFDENQTRPLSRFVNGVIDAYLSPDGDYLISVQMDDSVRILDINPKVPYKIVGRARYIPFDSKTVYGHHRLEIDSCDIKITDLDSGKTLKILRGHEKNVSCAIFSPDGSIIVSLSYDGSLRLWNADTGSQICYASCEHTDYPHTAAFSLDGKQLVTASKQELKVWDVGSCIQLGMDICLFDKICMVKFTDDGRGIITETERDYDILIDWEPLGELLDRVQKSLNNRQLTELEKKEYYLE